jgi:hypothetical protein
MKKTLSLLLLFPLFGCDCDGGGGLHQKKADIAASPNPLVFDTVPRGTTVTQLLHVENPGDFRLEVAAISIEAGAAEGFGVAGETAFSLEPGASRDVEVTFTAGDIATVEGTLLIQSNAAEKEQTRVTLQASRRQGPVLVVCMESIDIPLGFTCGSPALDFGRVRLTETHEALVTLRSEGTDPVAVSMIALAGHPSIEIDAPSTPVTIEVGQYVSVPVRFTASVQEQIEGSITVQSNDGVAPSTQLAIRGTGAEVGLCVEPAILDFGGVRAGTTKDLPIKLSNCGSSPIDITGAEVFVNGAEFSVVDPITAPITLPPQAGLNFELKMRYSPADEGEDQGRLRIVTSNGNALVPMIGDANACRLVVTPSSLHFMYDPAIGGEPKNILIENTGSQVCTVDSINMIDGCDEGFQFTDFGPRGAGDGLAPGEPPPPGGCAQFWGTPAVLQPGESLSLGVAFWPWMIQTATVSGRIEITAAERPGQIHVVDLSATVDFTSVCDLTVSPMTLSYGIISVGQRRILGVQLLGSQQTFTPCALDSVALTDDSNGAFILEADPPDIVFPEAVVFIEFAPTVGGVHQGTLEIVTQGDTPQTFNIALNGGAGSSSLCVEPRELPFGDRATPGTLDFNVSACSSDPVTVTALDWTTPDPEMSVFNPPALPFTLAASESRTITVQYAPQDVTGDTGILTVRSSDPIKPEIAVRATGGREIVPPEAGRYLYYWQILNGAQGDIMRQPLQGNLTSVPYWGDRTGNGCAGCHQLAPDGKYLAVTTLGTSRGINVIDVEANAIATAPGNYVEGLYMSWNPDVNTNPPYQYVYSANGDLQVASLYTGYIGPVAGADDPNAFETMPAWGPDGQIAFVRSPSECGIGCNGAGSIYLVDEAGGVAVPLAGASENNFANYYPRYSPNGEWIAYTLSMQALGTISAPDAQVRLVKADNSGQVLELTTLNGGASSYPTWSANGQFLSFASNRAGGQGSWDIYVAPIDPVTGSDGAATNVVEANTSSFEHSAQWSP